MNDKYAVERRTFDKKQLEEARSNDLSPEIQESFSGWENKDISAWYYVTDGVVEMDML